MTPKQLYEAAIERGETLESMGTAKASGEDISVYIVEIGLENDIPIETQELAHELIHNDKLEIGPTMNMAETKLVKMMLDQFFSMRAVTSAHEALGLVPDHPEVETNDWIDDVANELAKEIENFTK